MMRMGVEIAGWQAAYVLQRVSGDWRAVMAVADGETEAWAARGTRALEGKTRRYAKFIW